MRWVMAEKSAEVIVREMRIGGLEDARLNCETRERAMERTEPIRWADPAIPPARQPRPGVILRAGIGAGQRQRAHAKAPLFRKERRRTFVASE